VNKICDMILDDKQGMEKYNIGIVVLWIKLRVDDINALQLMLVRNWEL